MSAQEMRRAIEDLEGHIFAFEKACLHAGAYMPALATRLRIYADELASRYPDDTNGGFDGK